MQRIFATKLVAKGTAGRELAKSRVRAATDSAGWRRACRISR